MVQSTKSERSLGICVFLSLFLLQATAQQPVTPATPKQTGRPPQTAQPTPQSTPQPTASTQSTPYVAPPLPGPAAGPSPSVIPLQSVPGMTSQVQSARPLSLDEALRLANTQASAFQQASVNEKIAAEDLRQAKAAFLPTISAPLSYLYNTPALGLNPGEPRVQSFIANNAINEYQAYLAVSG